MSLLFCWAVLCLAMCSAHAGDAMPRQLRWFVGNPARPATTSFLLENNPNHLANTSTRVDDITGGVYMCCNEVTPWG